MQRGKKLILTCYLSYLFRLRLLSEDSYLLESLQSADKSKTHPKAKLQNAPTFTGDRSYCHVCLVLVIEIKTRTYKLCKRQSADTNVLIGRYRLSAGWLSVNLYVIQEYLSIWVISPVPCACSTDISLQ